MFAALHALLLLSSFAATSTALPSGRFTHLWSEDSNDGSDFQSSSEMDLHGPEKRALPGGWKNIGCVTDGSSRALNWIYNDGGLNNDGCVYTCDMLGYTYAGTEYGNQCWCGNSLANGLGSKADPSSCSTPCSGNKAQNCGGPWRLNLFQKTPPISITSLGCYVDYGTRILNGPGMNSAANNASTCAAWCKSQNYPYAGTEYGYQCFCGTSAPPSSLLSGGCDMACNANDGSMCGGYYRMSVYSIAGVSASPSSTAVGTTVTTAKTTSTPTTTTTKTPVTTATTANTPATTTLGNSTATSPCNAACTSQVGLPSIPASGRKYLWAHHMVGNTYSYTTSTWQDDINQASNAGIDGFALNFGSDSWQVPRMNDAYSVAAVTGFKLFLSIDLSSVGCSGASDAQFLSNLILGYAKSPAQATYQNKTLVSTFVGDTCTFGQVSPTAGWAYLRNLIRAGGKEIYLMPAVFLNPGNFQQVTWFDGLMNWNSAWPTGSTGGSPLDTSSDTMWMNNLPGRGYMPAISPDFFTYYGPNTWNKDWIYRSDDWLLARRFEQLISMRSRFDMAELVTWNDYGESHYVGPIRADQPNSQGWVNGYPHTPWLSLISFYAQAFKNGQYGSFNDNIWLWTRPHFKAATPTAPTLSRPTGWQLTDDNLYAFVILFSPANVTIWNGNNKGVWSLNTGVNKLSLASAVGAIGASIVRNGKVAKSIDSTGQFAYTNTPKDYNYNYWVTSA